MEKAVYEPKEDSFLLEEAIRTAVTPGSIGRALDMGCGSGILSITLAKNVGNVLAVDINPRAVNASRALAETEGAGNIEFRESDLFSNVRPDEKFDLIVWNMPYVPVSEEDEMDLATSCGTPPIKLFEFFEKAASHLTRGGRILYIVSSITPLSVSDVEARGYTVRIVSSSKVPFETLTVFEARPTMESDRIQVPTSIVN